MLTGVEKEQIIATVRNLLWERVGNVDVEVELFKSIEKDSVIAICIERFDAKCIPHYIRLEKRRV